MANSVTSVSSFSENIYPEEEQPDLDGNCLHIFLQHLNDSEVPLTERLSSRIAAFAEKIPNHREEVSQCIQDLRTLYRLSPRSQRTDEKFKRVEEIITALINVDNNYASLGEALVQLNQELILEERSFHN